jgi:hypothetical protein
MRSEEVLSNIRKVIAAIVVIAVAVGAVYLIASRMSARGADQPGRAGRDFAGGTSAIANQNADNAPARMPLGDWNNLIASAMRQHCAIEGMTKEQVEKAFGKPSTSTGLAGKGEVWKYEQNIEGDCIRNEVAKCVEHLGIHLESIYYFSPNGHLTYPSQDEVFHYNCVAEPFYSRYFKPLEHH